MPDYVLSQLTADTAPLAVEEWKKVLVFAKARNDMDSARIFEQGIAEARSKFNLPGPTVTEVEALDGAVSREQRITELQAVVARQELQLKEHEGRCARLAAELSQAQARQKAAESVAESAQAELAMSRKQTFPPRAEPPLTTAPMVKVLVDPDKNSGPVGDVPKRKKA